MIKLRRVVSRVRPCVLLAPQRNRRDAAIRAPLRHKCLGFFAGGSKHFPSSLRAPADSPFLFLFLVDVQLPVTLQHYQGRLRELVNACELLPFNRYIGGLGGGNQRGSTLCSRQRRQDQKK